MTERQARFRIQQIQDSADSGFSRFRIQDSAYSGFRIQASGFKIQHDSGFRIQDSRFMV
jgi:hypothetical protein